MHMQTLTFILVKCLTSTYKFFSILSSLPFQMGRRMVERLGSHLAFSQGQPTSQGLSNMKGKQVKEMPFQLSQLKCKSAP